MAYAKASVKMYRFTPVPAKRSIIDVGLDNISAVATVTGTFINLRTAKAASPPDRT